LDTVLLSVINNEVIWLQRALSDFNFKFSLKQLDEECRKFVASSMSNPRKLKTMQGTVAPIIESYLDVRQDRFGSFSGSHYTMQKMKKTDHKNWKHFLKLWYILRKLGVSRKQEIRMYIRGVSEKKNFPTKSGIKILPIKTLASSYCVLDFLIYLKEVWYERYTGYGEKWESEYRKRDFGQSHYLKLANQALGFLRLTLSRNRGSVFSSEIPSSLGLGAEEEELWAYYILSCSKITKQFWEKGWLLKLNPKVNEKVNSLYQESQKDPELQKVLKFANSCAKNLWEESGLPLYGDNDDFHLSWIVGDKPKLESEIRKWMNT
jgi:hypothetical protein